MKHDFSTHTVVVIHERALEVKCDGTARRCTSGPCSGYCNGRCGQLVGFVPTLALNDLVSRIDAVKEELREISRGKRQILSEGAIRGFAKECADCNLCKVCAGGHRRYSRDFKKCWPPGQDKCFAFLSKGGKPIRESPCALCEIHDKMLRDARRSSNASRTDHSRAQNKLRSLYAERRALVEGHPVDHSIFEG